MLSQVCFVVIVPRQDLSIVLLLLRSNLSGQPSFSFLDRWLSMMRSLHSPLPPPPPLPMISGENSGSRATTRVGEISGDGTDV